MSDAILTILSSAIPGGLVAGAIVFLFRSWIAERLRQSIAHEYAQKLETFKAQHVAATERLRAELAEKAATAAVATSTMTATHLAAYDRRLAAMETIWRKTVELRGRVPRFVGPSDFFLPEEYEGYFTKLETQRLLQGYSLDSIIERLGCDDREPDQARAFAGDRLYGLFYFYRALIGRVSLVLIRNHEKGSYGPWHTDATVRSHLKAVLDSEELSEFDGMALGRFQWICNTIQEKMVDHIARVLSGEESAMEGLEQAKRIRAAMAKDKSGRSADEAAM
ncbi:MAG: hypothetical protein KAY37_02455 [Phycisphaerae bacterium]|nr:hypothetical protein [Phycisphaerae bacterium]